MKTLLQTRQQLGLSQEAMAGLLGSSRSRLSHAEAGRRLLEPHAMQQFALLLQRLQDPCPAESSINANELLTPAIQTHLEELQFRLTVLRRQQKKLMQRRQQYSALSHCLPVLIDQVPGGEHAFKQQRKIKMVKATKEAQFELGNKEAFFKGMEIATLEFQLAYCREFVGESM